jgi:hypothetical protein
MKILNLDVNIIGEDVKKNALSAKNFLHADYAMMILNIIMKWIQKKIIKWIDIKYLK